jgi:predicted nucleotidyltransferase
MLSRDEILEALRDMDARARAAHLLVDISIYGGSALVLAFDARIATRDVDAVIRSNSAFARDLCRQIALERGWPEDWLNDGVKGYLSPQESLDLMRDFPGGEDGGLRVHLASAEYLFAMKSMAMRPEGIDGSHDVSDIIALAKRIGLSSAKEALALVEQFYPLHRIPPKVAFGIEEIMERIQAERNSESPT